MVIENEVQAVLVITKNGSSDYNRSVTLIGTYELGFFTQDLEFTPGQTMTEVFVTLVDDEIALEDVVQYQQSLQIPTGQTGVELGMQPTSVLEVADDDGKPTCCGFIVCNKYVQLSSQ